MQYKEGAIVPHVHAVEDNLFTTTDTGTVDMTERNTVANQSQIPFDEHRPNHFNTCLRCLQTRGKKHLQNIPEEVELMGLKRIFGEGYHIIHRLFWISIVIFGIGFAGFQIHSQISLYLSWPVNVLVNISHVSEIPFPRVIFCNYNYMKKSAFPQNLTGVDTTDVSGLFEADIANGMYQNVDWEDIFVEFAHQLNETLLEVSKYYSL